LRKHIVEQNAEADLLAVMLFADLWYLVWQKACQLALAA
jgi:hypothetical protein